MNSPRRRRGRLRFNGPRGAGLFSAGWVCIFRGLFLLPLDGTSRSTPHGIEAVAAGWHPAIYVYAALWLAAGLYAILRSFRTRDALACAAVFGLCGLWGVGYLISGIRTWTELPHPLALSWFGLNLAKRDWASAASYLGLAVLGGYWSRMVNPSRMQREARRD